MDWRPGRQKSTVSARGGLGESPGEGLPMCEQRERRRPRVVNVIVIAALMAVVLICEAWLRRHREPVA